MKRAHIPTRSLTHETKTDLAMVMPTIIIEGLKADVETKRELVRRITEVVRKIYKVHHVSVVIHENEPENVGVDGELLADIIAKRRG